MFAVHCSAHGTRVLIWSSGVEAVRNTDEGIEVDYRCTCGHRGTWLTGRRPSRSARLSMAGRAGGEYGVMRPPLAVSGSPA